MIKKMIYEDDLLKIEIIKGSNSNPYNDPSLLKTIDLQKQEANNLFLSIEDYEDKNTYTPKDLIEGVSVFKKDYQTNGFKIPKRSSLFIHQDNFSPIIIYTGYEVSKNKDQVIFVLKVEDLVKIRQAVSYYEIIIIAKKASEVVEQLISFGFDENQIMNINLETKKEEGILITNKRGIIKH